MISQKKYGVILGYTNIIAKNLVQLIYTPMLLSFVGQGDYGVFQTINSFTVTLGIFSVTFTKAYVRFYFVKIRNGNKDAIKKLNGQYLLLYLCFSLVALFFGVIFALNNNNIFSNSFSPHELELSQKLILIMVLNITITIFSSVFDSYILVHEKFRFQQSRQLFTTIANPFLSYFLLLCGLGAVGVGLSQLFITVLLLILNIKFALKNINMKFSFKQFDKYFLRSIFVFSVWTFNNQICDLINNNIPNVILGSLTSSSVVAVFALSIQIRICFMSLSTTISSVFAPQVNIIVTKTNSNIELSKLMTRIGRYQMCLICWIYGGFIVLGKFFIEKWAGPNFEDAYLIICITMLPFLVTLTQNIGFEIQYAKNKHKARSIVYLIMSIVNIVLTLLFSKSLGYWAPTIAYVLSITVDNLFLNWYYKKHIGIDIRLFWKRVIPIFFCGLFTTTLFYAIVHFYPVYNWILFMIYGFFFSITFFALIWFFILNKSEKLIVLKKLKISHIIN